MNASQRLVRVGLASAAYVSCVALMVYGYVALQDAQLPTVAGTRRLPVTFHGPLPPLTPPTTVSGWGGRVGVLVSADHGGWRYDFTVYNRSSVESGLRIRAFDKNLGSHRAFRMRAPKGWACAGKGSGRGAWWVNCSATVSEAEIPPGGSRSGFSVVLQEKDWLPYCYGIAFHNGQGFNASEMP